jgi:hypothetical protein
MDRGSTGRDSGFALALARAVQGEGALRRGSDTGNSRPKRIIRQYLL